MVGGVYPAKEYTADTLPEHIKGRVMSLNVLERDTFVDGVGYKVRDNMFYVSRYNTRKMEERSQLCLTIKIP